MNLARRITTVESRLPTAARPCWRTPSASSALGDLTALRAPRSGGRAGRATGKSRSAAAQPTAAGAMVETAVLTVREDGDNAWGGRKIAKVLQAAR